MNSAEGLALGGEQNEEIKHASAKPINRDSLDLLNFWCVGEVRRMTFTPIVRTEQREPIRQLWSTLQPGTDSKVLSLCHLYPIQQGPY